MNPQLASSIEHNFKGSLRTSESLRDYTTIKVGGKAAIFWEPEDEQSLAGCLAYLTREKVKFKILGAGSNLLIPDKFLDCVVIHLSHDAFKAIHFLDDGGIECGGAVRLQKLLQRIVERGYGDCEFLLGIPAQLGGAIVMNAGSHHKWIGDYIRSYSVATTNGVVNNVQMNPGEAGYRKGPKVRGVITSAILDFPKKDVVTTRQKMAEYSNKRKTSQDLIHPSAGCMFANPDGLLAAGGMIEELGLKGFSIGGAMISNKHANFVVNKTGEATYDDICNILKLVEEKVEEKYGIKLHREIKVWADGGE